MSGKAMKVQPLETVVGGHPTVIELGV